MTSKMRVPGHGVMVAHGIIQPGIMVNHQMEEVLRIVFLRQRDLQGTNKRRRKR